MTSEDLLGIARDRVLYGAAGPAVQWLIRILTRGESIRQVSRAVQRRAERATETEQPAPPRPTREELADRYLQRAAARRWLEQLGKDVEAWVKRYGSVSDRPPAPVTPPRTPPRVPPQRRYDPGRIRELINMPPAPEPRPNLPEPAPPTDTRRRPVPANAARAARGTIPNWLSLAVPAAVLLARSGRRVGTRFGPLVSNQIGTLTTVPGATPAPSTPKDPLSPPNPSDVPFAPGFGSPLGLSPGLCEATATQRRKKKRRRCDVRYNVAWTSGPNKGKVAGSRCFKFD